MPERSATFLSHTPPGGPFTVGSHHLARALAADGWRVWHVGTPVTAAHAVRLGDAEVRRRLRRALGRPGATDGYRHAVAWSLRPSGRPRARGVDLPALLEASTVVVVDEPLLVGALEALPASRRPPVVARPTDIAPSFGRRTAARAAAERRLLALADAAVATSVGVAAHLRQVRADLEVTVVPNGADPLPAPEVAAGDAWFAAEVRPRLGTAPALGYVGATDERLDRGLVRALAAAGPATLVLAGPGSQALAGPGVVALGPLPYARARAVLRHVDAGVLPLVAGPANAGRSPLKLFEHLVEATPVAAPSLPFLDQVPPAARPWVPTFAPGDATGARAAVGAALAAGPVPPAAAEGLSWDGRAAQLVALVEGLVETAR